jgi:hypothetical protein
MNISDYGDKFIDAMKHAIGLNYVSPRYGKYKPFRNCPGAPRTRPVQGTAGAVERTGRNCADRQEGMIF